MSEMKSAQPEIVHTFWLPMSRAQQKELERVWAEHGLPNGSMVLQGVISLGPFKVKLGKAKFNGAVINGACFSEIQKILKATQTGERKNDANGRV